MEWMRLEGISGPQSKPPAEDRLFTTMLSKVFNISRDGDSIAFLGNLCQCTVTLTVKKYFLMFRGNPLCFSLCSVLLVLSLGTTEKSLTDSLPFSSCLQGYIHITKIPPPSLLFTRLNEDSHFCFSSWEMLQFFNHLHGPLPDSFQSVNVLVLGSPELNLALPISLTSE